MSPFIATSWRRAEGSNDNTNDVPAGQAVSNVPSGSPTSTPGVISSPAPKPDSGPDLNKRTSATDPVESNVAAPSPSYGDVQNLNNSSSVPAPCSSKTSSHLSHSSVLVTSSLVSSSPVPTSSGSTIPVDVVEPLTLVSGSTTFTSSVTMVSQSVEATPVLQGTVSTQKSKHKGVIIGGAVAGAILIVLLLALLCCMKRRSRAKRDTEPYPFAANAIEGRSKTHACCNPHLVQASRGGHGTTPEMKQVPTSIDSLNGQTGASTIPLAGSHRPSRSTSSRPRSLNRKRPPPLKLESLVTPVINGPTNVTRKDPFADPNQPHLPTPGLGGNSFRDQREFTVVEVSRSPARAV